MPAATFRKVQFSISPSVESQSPINQRINALYLWLQTFQTLAEINDPQKVRKIDLEARETQDTIPYVVIYLEVLEEIWSKFKHLEIIITLNELMDKQDFIPSILLYLLQASLDTNLFVLFEEEATLIHEEYPEAKAVEVRSDIFVGNCNIIKRSGMAVLIKDKYFLTAEAVEAIIRYEPVDNQGRPLVSNKAQEHAKQFLQELAKKRYLGIKNLDLYKFGLGKLLAIKAALLNHLSSQE